MLKPEFNNILINTLLYKVFSFPILDIKPSSNPYFLIHSFIDMPKLTQASLNRGESKDSSKRSSCLRDRMSLTSFFDRRIYLTTCSLPSSTITLSEWERPPSIFVEGPRFHSLWDRKLVVSLTIECVVESPSLAKDVREGTEYFYGFIFYL
jgi:hypothetical protein